MLKAPFFSSCPGLHQVSLAPKVVVVGCPPSLSSGNWAYALPFLSSPSSCCLGLGVGLLLPLALPRGWSHTSTLYSSGSEEHF